MGSTEHVGVGAVCLLGRGAVWQLACEQPLRHFVSATELFDELCVEPRLVDSQVRVSEQSIAVEAFDVVALVCAAIAPDLDAVLLHRANQEGAGDNAAEGSGVEVSLAAGANVKSATGNCGQCFFDQRLAAVNQTACFSAIFGSSGWNRVDVVFVVLPEVRGVGERNSTLLAHPRDRHRCVEATGERDADLFADRKGCKNFRHAL